jgi:hypothetical protein
MPIIDGAPPAEGNGVIQTNQPEGGWNASPGLGPSADPQNLPELDPIDGLQGANLQQLEDLDIDGSNDAY